MLRKGIFSLTCACFLLIVLFLSTVEKAHAQVPTSQQCASFISDYLSFSKSSANNRVTFSLISASEVEAPTYTEGELTRAGWGLQLLSGTGTRYYSDRQWSPPNNHQPPPGAIYLPPLEPFSPYQTDKVVVTLNSITGAVVLNLPNKQLNLTVTSCAGGLIEGTETFQWANLWWPLTRYYTVSLTKLANSKQVSPSGGLVVPSNATATKDAAKLYQSIPNFLRTHQGIGGGAPPQYDYKIIAISPYGSVQYITGSFVTASTSKIPFMAEGTRYFSDRRFNGLYPFNPMQTDKATLSLNPNTGETIIYYPWAIDRLNIRLVKEDFVSAAGTLPNSTYAMRYFIKFYAVPGVRL
jgi:hypothetical protein